MGDETKAAKARLRLELRDRVAQLGPDRRRWLAAEVVERALELPQVAGAQRIFTCLAFGDEVDTWPLVERLLDAERQVFVPRVDPADGTIHVHPYPCELRTLSFGLRQPPRGAPELPAEEVDEGLDVALVLGLGYDRRGCRLGYGRGYFDRFLAGRTFPAIGLAYHCQLVDRLPVEPHDVAMTAVVTEKSILRPRRG